MQTWKNITVNLPGYNLKNALELLSGIDALSLSIVTKPGIENFEWFEETKEDLILSGSDNNLVILVEASSDTSDIIKELKYHLKLDYYPKYAVEIFEDKDWVVLECTFDSGAAASVIPTVLVKKLGLNISKDGSENS